MKEELIVLQVIHISDEKTVTRTITSSSIFEGAPPEYTAKLFGLIDAKALHDFLIGLIDKEIAKPMQETKKPAAKPAPKKTTAKKAPKKK